MIALALETIGRAHRLWTPGVHGPLPRTARAVLLLIVAGLAAACDKVPLTAPTGSTVTLFSNTTIVPVNGTAEITATVIESGGTQVQNGTLVTFSTTIGTVDPAEARTSGGKATVRLVAGGRSGTATVRAFSGGVVSGDLELLIGGAAAGRVALNANPSSVSASGGTSVVTAIVFDTSGNRLSGVPVSFTTTAGSLSASVSVSDSNGEARSTLTTSRTATVTAQVGGSGEGAVQATVQVEALALPTVTVSASPQSPVAGQTVVFSINATATGGASIRTLTVDYGDGQVDTLGPTSSVSHVYSAGTYTVRVTVEDTNGGRGTGSTTIVVAPAAPVLVTLIASPSTVNTGAVVTFTVNVNTQGGSASVQSVSFNFGDGNQSGAIPSLTRTHIYGQSGNFLAVATVRFTDGSTGRAEAAVRVN